MEIDAKKKARIAALSEEIHGIHFVNSLYWSEYQRRQDRLDEIRRELAQLQSG
jgi:chromosome segregation ATPase